MEKFNVLIVDDIDENIYSLKLLRAPLKISQYS